MGASGWDYVVPFDEDVAGALRRLRAEVFASGDYYWLYEGERPRPGTERELWADEEIRHCMTHSVLDVFEVGTGGGQRAFGRTFAVSDEEAVREFGTARPTLESVADRERLLPLLSERGGGRHLVLYADGEPSQLLFFGATGD
ncbi:hypothetical protein ACQP00_44900 [Dactylosporangium sp. CS-047395]|uniref:hypothetical protein n=1 Tax=Dactylosporangium sp. CS-047395 TaxID=3239936 RepID=UPI003D89E7D4